MATNLSARASGAPLPTGLTAKKPGAGNTGVAWPAIDNWLLPGDGSGAELGPFNRPERFWLRAGASFIEHCAAAAWTRYDYKWRLVVNGAYGNDLLGFNAVQKANSNSANPNPWWGISIEALWYCEANTNYIAYLLSAGNGASSSYYQYVGHYNIWAYTIGEGVY